MRIIKIIVKIFNKFIDVIAKGCEERDELLSKLTPEQRYHMYIKENWLDF